MSGDTVLGIDLGTTNSVVAVSDGGEARVLSNELGQRLVPSVVSFKPGGGVLVGEAARERRLLDASSTIYSIKRLIGRPFRSSEVRTAQERFAFDICESPTGGVVVGVRGETYTLTEISAFVLREVTRVAELSLGSTSRAVVTVPANFNELQRSATKAAGRVAGLEVLRIINEPTAAALAYGYGKERPERVAVFDLGGGTFDVTILDLENDVFEVIATAGDSFLGGDDVDLQISEMMCDAFLRQHRWDPRSDRQAYERLRAAAEWAKCQLSVDHAVELTVEELHYGNGGRRLDLEFELERTALERAVQPLLARSFDVCNDAFREAGMKPSQVDSVVLVGGSTRMPLVRSMVAEYFKKEPRDEIDPDLVVAQGAAIHGYAVGGQTRKRTRSLGRVALKKVSSKDLSRLQEERKARQASLPKQPAFAPTAQVDASERPPARIGSPPVPPPPLGRKKRPGTQLGMGAVRPPPPPPPALPFDEETVTRSASEVLGSMPRPRGVMPTDERLAATDLGSSGSRGLDMSAIDGDRPTFDASSPALNIDPPSIDLGLDAPLEDAPTQVQQPLEESPTQVRASDVTSFDLPTFEEPANEGALPGVIATKVVAVGRTDNSQVDAQLADFLRAESGAFPQPTPPAAPPPPPMPAAAPVPPPETSLGSTLDGLGDQGMLDPFEGASQFPSAPPQPVMELVDRAPPLLMDVTPHSLGIETAGGYCQHLLRRNAPIPAEQMRIFSTASDHQEMVSIRVCQGEEKLFDGNQLLGAVELTGLRKALRGEVQIDVAFQLDADGTLAVHAIDRDTGKEQSIRINLLGGATDKEIDAMRARQQSLVG